VKSGSVAGRAFRPLPEGTLFIPVLNIEITRYYRPYKAGGGNVTGNGPDGRRKFFGDTWQVDTALSAGTL